MIRLTFAAPEGDRYNANQLMRVMGAAEDERTFPVADYADGKGNRYCVASGLFPADFRDRLTADLVEPDHNANMTAARAAQAFLRFEGPASPDAICVIEGDDVAGALAVLALRPVEAYPI